MKALLGWLTLFAGSALAGPLAMSETAGIRWACGGVGVDERFEMAALERQANVQVLFVTVKRGGYLADARFSVYEAGAAAPRLQLTADGPICLLALPAGRYRLEAVIGDTTRAQQVAIAAAAPLHRVVFSFPGEPWDGIWASDEEKRGAKSP